MKYNKLILGAFILGTVLPAAAWAGPGHKAEHSHEMMQEKNQSDVAKTLRAYALALQISDLPGVESHVAKEGTEFTIFEGKGANIGWADYRDNHLAPELNNPDFKITQYEFAKITDTVSGDWASATFAINMSYTYKGEAKNSNSRGTAVLKQENGKWVITHLHTS